MMPPRNARAEPSVGHVFHSRGRATHSASSALGPALPCDCRHRKCRQSSSDSRGVSRMQAKRHLLLVDDEPSIRVTLPLVLEDKGFAVRVAADVPGALSEIDRRRFDVLVSDLNISGPADGLLILSAMRERQPQCVRIVLTGFPSFETVVEGIRLDVDDYLVKPADIDYLVATIEKKLAARLPAQPS
jgi:ActR/RegA family two-component response regulator